MIKVLNISRVTFFLLVQWTLLSCSGPAVETREGGILATPSVSATSNGTDAVFSWNAIVNANHYRYRLSEEGGNPSESTTRTTSLTVAMSAGSTYSFQVKAVPVAGGLDKESDWSSVVSITDSRDPEIDPVPGPGPGPGPEPGPSSLIEFPAAEQDGIVRAFPGAAGGGRNATGGRGGKVIHVTNLNDSGAGSLRAAINQSGPRIIVFDVAGIIELQSRLEIKSGDITIAGQTAPGDGICLKNHNFRINASNVIIRFIRCRMGDEKMTEDDAMNCYGKSGYKNIIIDHCSMSWSTDECGSFYGVEDFTLQYCILSESLRNSVHDKGKHGYGGIWGGQNAAFHHNLLAHHDSRNPRFDHDYVSELKGPVHFVNNVIYNWGGNSAYGGESKPGTDAKKINMVGNYYKPGPATGSHKARLVNPTTKCSNCEKDHPESVVPGLFYVDGNYMYGSELVTSDNWMGVEPDDASKKSSLKALAYQGESGIAIQDAQDAFESVLKYSGASLSRDRIDTRIAGGRGAEGKGGEVRSGTAECKGSNGSSGGLIDTQTDAGGWPEYSATAEQIAIAAADSDADGIPDHYEELFGLNPNYSDDASARSLDPQKLYTNLESYLHYLVQDIVNQK